MADMKLEERRSLDVTGAIATQVEDLLVEPRAATIDWGAAVHRYNARVLASVLALAVPFHRAEEIVAQAWAKLLEKDHAGELAQITLPGLAIQQARFLALTWLKTAGRDIELPAEIGATSDTPERSLIARRDVATALAVLAASSASAQAVFFHLYEDPPPSHEIVAQRVGLSVQRVRQIVCEVRAKIRAALEAA